MKCMRYLQYFGFNILDLIFSDSKALTISLTSVTSPEMTTLFGSFIPAIANLSPLAVNFFLPWLLLLSQLPFLLLEVMTALTFL